MIFATQETTIFVYDAAGKLVAEYSTTVAPVSHAKVSYLTNDHLGSPRINTDATGVAISRHDYHPFGEEITRASYGTENVRQKFTGFERDNETDLDFAQARYYAKQLGRFMSADEPFADQFEGDPQSWSMYAYVRNNPLNLVDPFGLSAECPKNKTCGKDEGGNYEIDPDGTKIYIEPGIIEVKTREEVPDKKIKGFLDGFRPMGEASLPYLEAITPSPLPGGSALGGLFNFGRRLLSPVFNLFRAAPKLRPVLQGICCFVAGTPALTKDGLKPIEEIKVGDEVLSFNERSGQVEYKSVLQTFERYEKEILRISVEGEGESLGVTPEHPFYVRVHRARDDLPSSNVGEWTAAGLLQVGDEIRLDSGNWTKVAQIGKQKKGATTYNFEVADNHNYFVGNTGLLVHNSCIKVLQTGGNTIKNATVKGLEEAAGRPLTKDQVKNAVEALKKANLLRNDFHPKIMSNGNYVNKQTGEVIDNIISHLK